MAIQVDKRLLNTVEYHKMSEVGILAEDDRLELINGEIIKMSPINSRHASHVKKIAQFLIQLLKEDYLLGIQDPIQLGEFSEPEPDIVVLQAKEDFYHDQHPTAQDILLIIEIADSSLDYDRSIKSKLYAEAGISDYWIINLQEHCLETYHQLQQQAYQQRNIYQLGESVQLPVNKAIIAITDLIIQPQ